MSIDYVYIRCTRLFALAVTPVNEAGGCPCRVYMDVLRQDRCQKLTGPVICLFLVNFVIVF